MSRKQLIEMARRHVAHGKAGTVDRAPAIARVPARQYLDPERAERERERIFRRLPLVLGFSCELREPGAYKAIDAAGVPVLLTRPSSSAWCATRTTRRGCGSSAHVAADPGRDVLFGRNEQGGQRFHRFVDALLGAEDGDLPALFAGQR